MPSIVYYQYVSQVLCHGYELQKAQLAWGMAAISVSLSVSLSASKYFVSKLGISKLSSSEEWLDGLSELLIVLHGHLAVGSTIENLCNQNLLGVFH